MARIAGNVCNTYIHIDLLVEEISTSIENNTSTVTWSLVGYMGSGGTSAQWYSNSYHTINVNINGKSVYSLANTTQKAISIGTNATQSNPTVIASGTTTVPHNEDGTKNCACSFSVVYRYSSAFSWSGSGNVALTNIARATVPRLSVSSAKLGDKVTISLPRASANYTHRIDYDVKSLVSGLAGGGTSGTVTGTSYEWTVPTNLSQYFPSERSTTVTFTVTTYNGSKQVGTPQTATLKVEVPDYTPTISSVSITDPKGYLNTYGGFVQGKSNANVAITASGKYDSSIILYLANVEKGYNSTSSSITTDTLLNSGTTTATIKVVDSRSKVATVTQNITVLPYAAPVIASFNAYRCKSATDSTVDDMGEYIAVSHSTSVSSLNSKNTKNVTVQYRQAGATTWNTLSGSIFTASSDKRWEVRLTVTDKFESTVAVREVSVAYTLMDFNASGKGMAIGKVSEGDNFDVNMGAMFRKGVNVPLLADNTGDLVSVPTAGTVNLSSTQGITDVISTYKSFIGSIFAKNVWHNLISLRHRDGAGEGANYGMYLKAPLTRDGNLVWNKQHGAGTWSGERTILDSNNYTNYVKYKMGGIAEQAYDASVWGKAGYIVLAKIVVKGNFMSGANIIFTLSSFGGMKRAESKISLVLSNVGTVSSTTVTELATCNTPSIYYVLTQDTSANTATIEIIAYKAAYDEFAITHISTQRFFRDRATVSFPMTFETSLRSGAVAATNYTILDSDNYSTKIPTATQSAVGLMSAADKKKVDNNFPTSNQNATNGYIRFPSAKIQIAWIKKTVNTNINHAWGSIYETAVAYAIGNWAAAFSSVPVVSYNAYCNDDPADINVNSFVAPTTTAAGQVYLNRATGDVTSKSYTITAIAVGTYA